MVLEIKKAFKRYEQKEAVLNGIDLELKRGSFECIMGSSGSGKSTLLHIIAGLLSPDEGEVLVADKAVHQLGDSEVSAFRRDKIGMIFQDFNLLPSLSVEDNVRLPLLLGRKTVDETAVDELLERFELTAHRHKLPQQLSGGQRQRVAIVRALIINPGIILADEPTGNLDSISGRNLCELLQSMNRERKCTILLVTHNPQVAAFSDRVHLLKDGIIERSFDTGHDVQKISSEYIQVLGPAS